MRPKLISFFCILAALTFGLAIAQTKKPVTPEDILQMVKAGLSEDMIIKFIQANDTALDTSVQGIVALKNAGVSDRIIEAMIETQARTKGKTSGEVKSPEAGSEAQPTTAPTISGHPKIALSPDPWPTEVASMPREIGLYYSHEGKFTQLFGKPIVGTKTGGFIKKAFTVGISKTRTKGQLPGKHAQLQLSQRQPAFYFYLPEGQTPEDFVIIRTEVKSASREFEVGASGGFTGTTSRGLALKNVFPILIERLASRVYRVTPDRELEEGEYGLLGTFTSATIGLAGGGEKIYDFGITKKR